MSLSLYCSLTSCIELWSRAPVRCYKILQDGHQRYQLHTAFYSFSCNFQFFPPNAGNCKSFTNRITIPFQILSTYIISKPQSFPFPRTATLTDSLYSQLPTMLCTRQNAIQLACNSSLHRFTILRIAPGCRSSPSMQYRSLFHLMLVLSTIALACDVLRSLKDHVSRCSSFGLRPACLHPSL